MASKTTGEIKDDIYALLRHKPISDDLTGSVYFQGLRPKDSRLEDTIIAVTTATADEVQQGVIAILVYVPDITVNGLIQEQTERTRAIERALNAWCRQMTAGKSDYLFKLKEAVTTDKEAATNQHFVTARLGFKIY